MPYFELILVYPGTGQASSPPMYFVSNPSIANDNISAFISENLVLYSSILLWISFSVLDSLEI